MVELVNATRYCNEDGEWEEPDVTNCLSRVTEVLCIIRNVSRCYGYHCKETHSYTVAYALLYIHTFLYVTVNVHMCEWC